MASEDNLGRCLERIRAILFSQTKLEGYDIERLMVDITRAIGDYGIAEINEMRQIFRKMAKEAGYKDEL